MVAGNWKMNGDRDSIVSLIEGLGPGVDQLTRCEILVCPPYVYLPLVAELIRSTDIELGAQDLDVRSSGAVTGGVSAAMLRDMGCSHVIVGHSERRTLFGEDDETVAAKFEQALDSNLLPILCVGETLEERRAGATLDVVSRQLDAAIDRVGADRMRTTTVAYEPVWAIGTGESATPQQAEEVHKSLRDRLASIDNVLADAIRILYGGSVTENNAESLFANENVDGALVGGASLKPASFTEICKAADIS